MKRYRLMCSIKYLSPLEIPKIGVKKTLRVRHLINWHQVCIYHFITTLQDWLSALDNKMKLQMSSGSAWLEEVVAVSSWFSSFIAACTLHKLEHTCLKCCFVNRCCALLQSYKTFSSLLFWNLFDVNGNDLFLKHIVCMGLMCLSIYQVETFCKMIHVHATTQR